MQNPELSKLMELIRDLASLDHIQGIQTGWTACGAYLIEASGGEFAKGNDEKAEMMRRCGREIQHLVTEREKEVRPQRAKQRENIYHEIVGHLERMIYTEKENTR